MNEFHKLEYEQCYDLVKYYDERHQSLVTYASGLSSAIPSLLLAIYQLGDKAIANFWNFTAIIAAVTAIGLLSLFTVLIQTRLYFVYPARQVNSIRKFCLDKFGEGLPNQMYLNTTFNAFKWSSSHTLLHLFVAMQVGAFIGIGLYASQFGNIEHHSLIAQSATFASIATAVLFFGSAWYLHSNSKKHPDQAVHGESTK